MYNTYTKEIEPSPHRNGQQTTFPVLSFTCTYDTFSQFCLVTVDASAAAAARLVLTPFVFDPRYLKNHSRTTHLTHQAGYLFPGIAKRRNAYLEANPDCRPIISLGIGDTTQASIYTSMNDGMQLDRERYCAPRARSQ